MPRDSSQVDRDSGRLRRWMLIFAAVAALAFVALVGTLILEPWKPSPGTEPSVGPAPPASPPLAELWHAIQLVGVIPDGGDDLLDPRGEKIGTTLGSGEWNWGSDTMSRTLVFDIPQDPRVDWVPQTDVVVSRAGHWAIAAVSAENRKINGRRQRFVSLLVNRSHSEMGWFRSHDVPVEQIDVTLSYYAPWRNVAAWTFPGPFEIGKAVSRRGGGALCTLTPAENPTKEGGGTRLQVSLSRNSMGPYFPDPFANVFAYDLKGRRHRLEGQVRFGPGMPVNQHFVLKDLPLSQIDAITIGEVAQQKTFRNIRVCYPDRPVPGHPEYLDRMAEALDLADLPAQQLRGRGFKSPEEVVKVIDIVRGKHIDYAWQVFHERDFSMLPPEGREKLRRAARTWAEHADPRGIEMGLKGRWREFILPGLRALEEGRGNPVSIVHQLFSHGSLSPEELDGIAAVLETRDDPRGLQGLVVCLLNHRLKPGGRAAIQRTASSEKVWLWWPVVNHLVLPGGLTVEELPRELQIKYYAKTGPDRGKDPDLAAAARELLATLPTAKLSAMETRTLEEVMRSVAENLPRDQARRTFLALLRDCVIHWEDYRPTRYGTDRKWGIDQAVRYLNHWYGLDIGGLGSDVKEETRRHSVDWIAVAEEALARFEKDPPLPVEEPETGDAEDPDDPSTAAAAGGKPLEFRIAPLRMPSPQRDQWDALLAEGKIGRWWLDEDGPAAPPPDYFWLPIYSRFRSLGKLTFKRHGGEYYVLVSNRPDEFLAAPSSGGPDWGLVSVFLNKDPLDHYNIGFRFDSNGREAFYELTSAHEGQRLAFIVGDVVTSAPLLGKPRRDDRAYIAQDYTREQAVELGRAMARGMPATSPPPALFFPEVERTLSDQAGLVDLDAGEIVPPPARAFGDDAAARDWMEEHGVDLCLDPRPDRATLTAYDMVIDPLPGDRWETADRPLLLETAAGPAPAGPAPVQAESLPATFIIRTREGGIGLLQVHRTPADQAEVHIRYKLLVDGPVPKEVDPSRSAE